MQPRIHLTFVLVTTIAALAPLAGCALDGVDPPVDLDSEATSELSAASSNPAAFDLHCLWNGESYASRAPNIYAAQAIRNACEIQAAQIRYVAPGMYPLQFRMPTAGEGIDCSGLTSNVWYRATSGFVALPHSAAAQEARPDLPHIPFGQQRPGDLIFYVSPAAASGKHVAMYLGDGLMIEAGSSTVGVRVTPVRSANFSSVARMGGGG